MIRAIRPADLEQIHRIEQQVQPNPWKIGMFQDCLRMGYHGYVIVQGDDVQAYGILSSAAQESHILTLAVEPSCQRRGLGQKLLSFLLGKAREDGSETVFLEVRCSNLAALQLYRKLGFNEIGTRKNYYARDSHPLESRSNALRGGREDAIVMAKTLSYNEFSRLHELSFLQTS